MRRDERVSEPRARWVKRVPRVNENTIRRKDGFEVCVTLPTHLAMGGRRPVVVPDVLACDTHTVIQENVIATRGRLTGLQDEVSACRRRAYLPVWKPCRNSECYEAWKPPAALITSYPCEGATAPINVNDLCSGFRMLTYLHVCALWQLLWNTYDSIAASVQAFSRKLWYGKKEEVAEVTTIKGSLQAGTVSTPRALVEVTKINAIGRLDGIQLTPIYTHTICISGTPHRSQRSHWNPRKKSQRIPIAHHRSYLTIRFQDSHNL